VSWAFSLYVGCLFVNAAFCVGLAVSTLRLRDRPGGLPLGLLLLAIAEWSLALGFEMTARPLSARILWSKIQYVGLTVAPVLLFLFSLELTRQVRGIRAGVLLLLSAIPLTTLALAWTNEWHRLIWTAFTPNEVLGGRILVYGHGTWFWIWVVYLYSLLSVATLLLIRAAFRYRYLHRRQVVGLLVSMVPPWGLNAFYLAAPPRFQGLDLTPVGFMLTGVILVWSLRHLHLLKVAPVARDVVIDEMREGVIVCDRQDRVVDVNPAAQAMLGIRPDAVVGESLEVGLGAWVPMGDSESEEPKTGGEVQIEGVGCLEWRMSPLQGPGGDVFGRLIILQDITERKTAQDELRQLNSVLEAKVESRTAEIRAEKERQEAVLRSVGDGILMVDGDRAVRYVNAAFSALTGYSAKDVIGLPIADLIGEMTPEEVDPVSLPDLEATHVWRGDVRARRKDGPTYDAALTVAPVKDRDGQVEGHVCTLRDETQRRRLDRARDTFIENVSHQFRTPVATLRLYAHLLGREEVSPATREHLEVMEEQIRWLEGLIEDVVEITALDSGKGVMHWERISLHRVFDCIQDCFRDRFDAAGITLTCPGIPSGFPSPMGDEARLTQALYEIVENALLFTPRGGRVDLLAEMSTEPSDGTLTIKVRDTGPGIPVDEQGSVFERFFRGQVAASGQTPGTGLGLSIARAIVEAHGGEISLYSAESGSSFAVRLPGSSLDGYAPARRVPAAMGRR